MVTSLDNLGKIVYWIIIIIIAVWVLWAIYSFQKSSIDHSLLEGADEPSGRSDILDGPIPSTPVRTDISYDYHKNNVANVRFGNPEQIHESSTMTFKDFKSIITSESFLNDYHRSIRNSLYDKMKRYQIIYKVIVEDLTMARSKTSTTMGIIGHDTVLERLQKSEAEVKDVILTIKKRLNTISMEAVIKGLNEAVFDTKRGIVSLIGREDVKDFLALQIYSFSRNSKVFTSNFQNLAILGSSGVGKTKVADTISFVYAKCGILARDKIRITTKKNWTSSYVNESPTLASELLFSTFEGVLFIDEAYDLTPDRSIFGKTLDHGAEAIVEMVNHLDKYVGLNIVLAAGYAQPMKDRFMEANEGMPRRFPHTITLDNYDSKALTDILIRFMIQIAPDLPISKADANYLFTLIDEINTKQKAAFEKQAGDMQNLSACLTKSIYGNKNYSWKPGDLHSNSRLLLDGVNMFLKSKEMKIIFYEHSLIDEPIPKDQTTSSNISGVEHLLVD